jgi:hypothetical protein
MNKKDFWRTPDFTYKEVVASKADATRVKVFVLVKLQSVRTELGVVTRICENGLNSGKHISVTHGDDDAIDFYFDHYIDPITVICAMIRAGFTGIGVYKNVGGYYSYHGDVGEGFRQWYREYKDDGTHEDVDIFNSKLRD